ncbi:MAG TPA: adenosylcobinamide-GDP ribazoletransferase [Methanoregulaceae archaeon]|nr:adenosylcobinamide-GDP ribazoletransferase [Methanoregulaceae archaeon]HQP82847.1 adenosylcobinamide-GDP ribazoletransferase [Methanoregulaceae archaeon]
MLLNRLRALLQFTTILPLGRTVDFSLFADHTYLYPLSGYVIGGLAGLAACWISIPEIRAAVALIAVLCITGANHFDGLLDLGDGLMAHGGREGRIRALTDRQIGTGGFAAGGTVLLLTFAALSSSPQVLWALIVGEVLAKFSMAFLTAYGTPFHDGLHALLHRQSKPWFPVAAGICCIPLALLPLPHLPLLGAAIAAVLIPLLLRSISQRQFGGVNGDVVGASGEITRAATLCALVIIPASALF